MSCGPGLKPGSFGWKLGFSGLKPDFFGWKLGSSGLKPEDTG